MNPIPLPALLGVLLIVQLGQPPSRSPTSPVSPRQPLPPGRADPSGPWNDEIHFATSPDSLTWTESPDPIMKKASVPDLIELSGQAKAGPKGALCIYTVDFNAYHGARTEGLSRLLSTDGGKTWTKPEAVTILGKPTEGAAVDPAAVQLNDGRMRLYFYLMGPPPRPERPDRPEWPRRPDDPSVPQTPRPPTVPGVPPPAPAQPPALPELPPRRQRPDQPEIPVPPPGSPVDDGVHRIYSAVSEDGVAFTMEDGARYEGEQVTDPEVVRWNREWLMFLSRGPDVLLARSPDGLMFKRDEAFTLAGGGVPGAVVLADSMVRVYQSGREGIISVLFDPASGKVTRDDGVRIARGQGAGLVADPAVWERADGGFVMVLKRRPGPTNQAPPGPQRPPGERQRGRRPE